MVFLYEMISLGLLFQVKKLMTYTNGFLTLTQDTQFFLYEIIITQSFMKLDSLMYSNTVSLAWYEKLMNKNNSRQNERKIIPFKEDKDLPSNEIHTCKYNAYNFVPKNLFEQLTKPSNLYFIIIGIFQILPYTTLTNGVPVIYLPLGIIVVLSAIKDLYEDYKRSVSDKAENYTQYIQVNKSFEDIQPNIQSKDIVVGMVIKVLKDQPIPADGLILGTPSADVVFVSTKNLDGQTNLKRKKLLKNFNNSNKAFSSLQDTDLDSKSTWQPFMVEYEPPNCFMNQFKGKAVFSDQTEQSITIDNICLRGSQLKNSDFIFLLALYTGHDTKILLSMNNPPSKRSTIQCKLIRLIILIFCTILVLAIIMSVLKLKTVNRNILTRQVENPASFIVSIFSWILNLTNLVPISLIVTLESVKLFEGKMISWDKKMATDDFETIVNCSNVLEDLGTIECIASDKTGTLTKNKLTLREIGDGNVVYTSQNYIPLPIHLLELLCLCHQAYVNHQGNYESQSQDQTCILQFCGSKGCTLLSRSDTEIRLKFKEVKLTYRILQVIEFTSDRKRQSVIYRDKQGKTYIVTKGADDTIQPLLKKQNSILTKAVMTQLEVFASKGYRTLLMGYRQLDSIFIDQWIQSYGRAKQQNNKDMMSKLVGQVQIQFQTACAIGIEDELQDEVPETIRTIVEAGIRFVIISGDKKQTVRAIAKNLQIDDEPIVAKENKYDPELYKDKKLVVFARCTPKQKQQIVSSMQGRVLAIGDGANDVAMLTKATIGVGIAGKQGKAAVQSADFGIPQFKYLRRLLFYYGREFYRKNAELVKYNFYKNFLYTFPQVTFAFYSGYTGVAIYQSYMSQLFNLIFTSLPIMIYALFDQSEEEKHLLKNKENMFALSKKEIFFGNWRIFFYLLQSVVLGFITSYLCFLLTPIVFRSPNDLNIYEISSVLMLYVVIYANLRVLFMQKCLNIMVLITASAGIALYFAAFKAIMLFSTVIQRSISIIFQRKTGFILLICILASLIATLLFETVLNYIYRKEEKIIQMTQFNEIEQVKHKSQIQIALNPQ